MNHVISFSTGLSSALTVERALAKYNKAIIVFMDTLIEDEDNYRFQVEVYNRWRALYPLAEFVVLAEGRTPYQVATDNKMIFNQKLHPCTRILKIEQFTKWLKDIEGDSTIYIGIGFDEVHRCNAITRNYNEAGYTVDYPLLWSPIEHRPLTQVVKDDWGIEPPRMYSQGYSHANCGGCCVAQGVGDWIRTLTYYPDRYARVEAWERDMRQTLDLDYAICRDQSNGEVKPQTLETIRLNHQNATKDQLSLFDFESGCFSCGVGDLLTKEALI